MDAPRRRPAEVNVREARQEFRALIDRVVAGEEVLLLRHGKPVARLLPPEPPPVRLPPLGDFRARIAVGGRPVSEQLGAAAAERE